jgi:hypothetical protein
MSCSLIDNNTVLNIKNDTLKFVVALVFSFIIAGKNLFTNDCYNTKIILITLIGLAIYHIVISKIFLPHIKNPTLKLTLNDIIQFSTIIIVAKYIVDHDNLHSTEFYYSLGSLLIGFLLYDLILNNIIVSLLTDAKLQSEHIIATNDVLKFSSIATVFGLLNFLLNGKTIDLEYLRLCVGYISGLTVYNLYLS